MGMSPSKLASINADQKQAMMTPMIANIPQVSRLIAKWLLWNIFPGWCTL
jgi:hypothetical protein